MKVYFTGSLHNKDIDKEVYQQIVTTLEKMGHKVKADQILKPSVREIEAQKPADLHDYYQNLKKWLGRAEVMVCEVSYPSTLNIGHEVSLGLDKGIPIIALYQKGRAPGILQGIVSEKLVMLEYELDTLKDVLTYGMEEANAQMDVRFNFFISPQIGNYLDQISKKRRVPRAVYLRRLIEEDMKNNKEFSK